MPVLPITTGEQSEELQAVCEMVRKRKEESAAARKPYEARWDEWYGLHRNYRRYRRDLSGVGSEADRDEVVNNAQREFGAELFIPYVFMIVETVSPRLLMNDPRMKVKPKRGLSPESAEAISEMYDERQAEINYALKLQPIARRGLKYGLGVGKTFWNRQGRMMPVEEGPKRTMQLLKARLSGQPDPPPTEFVVFDEGPDVEDVELFDFYWDPAAKNIETSRYAIHRTWRDTKYVEEMVERGPENGGWEWVDIETIGTGSENERLEVLSNRAESSGLEGFEQKAAGLHEVWEYHDGEKIHTILNGKLCVLSAETPFAHRELPFQIYRPTLQEGEFVGIGEIEPIVHLQYELNTLRSQRRDNATLVLQKAFMYTEGMVDPEDLVVGPGKGIPVYGNPNEVLVPLPIGEIPASGYQEEAALKGDIELTSGIAETVAGGSGGGNASAETATGIQLVQAAANVRVEMKTKLMHAEMIRPAGEQFRQLWIQHAPEGVDEEGNPKAYTVTVEKESGYEFKEVTKAELEQVRAIIPDEDSTAPENSPQKRNDALALYNQTRGNEVVDQRKAVQHLLRNFDVGDPESWVIPEQTQMNPQVAQMMGETMQATFLEAGMDEEQANNLALMVMQRAMQSTGVSEPPGAEEMTAPPPEDPMAEEEEPEPEGAVA